MDTVYLNLAISILVPLLVLAASYGAISSRIKSLEDGVKQFVTREELRLLSARIDEVGVLIRDLRNEILIILRKDHDNG